MRAKNRRTQPKTEWEKFVSYIFPDPEIEAWIQIMLEVPLISYTPLRPVIVCLVDPTNAGARVFVDTMITSKLYNVGVYWNAWSESPTMRRAELEHLKRRSIVILPEPPTPECRWDTQELLELSHHVMIVGTSPGFPPYSEAITAIPVRCEFVQVSAPEEETLNV